MSDQVTAAATEMLTILIARYKALATAIPTDGTPVNRYVIRGREVTREEYGALLESLWRQIEHWRAQVPNGIRRFRVAKIVLPQSTS